MFLNKRSRWTIEREEADLVLDFTFPRARRRCAGDGIDEMVRAHLDEVTIVLPVLTDENRLHSSPHVFEKIIDVQRELRD
ncbi:protein of unknown function [Methylocella tundrae]|uniref:Uncharacterized protein n=1 Tax=Methylocella tundrae TaxID=227605 RepID=A0A4U8YYZ6_METTU|nr:protein of unknown function [Methylocella tundrae]